MNADGFEQWLAFPCKPKAGPSAKFCAINCKRAVVCFYATHESSCFTTRAGSTPVSFTSSPCTL